MADYTTKRKVILDLAITLDGLIEGKNGEIDWCIMDPEMNFNDFLNQVDTIFYGREKATTYGDNLFLKKGAPKLTKRCGIWFIVKRNMCFPELKTGPVKKQYL